jgi:hypothetical protein
MTTLKYHMKAPGLDRWKPLCGQYELRSYVMTEEEIVNGLHLLNGTRKHQPVTCKKCLAKMKRKKVEL